MRRPVVWCLALCLVLGALEGGARLVRAASVPEVQHPWGHPWLPRDARNFEPDEDTYFRLRRDHPEHSAQGFRERRVYERAHPGALRIMVLGEAEAYGTQVRFDEAWPRVLESLLAPLVRAERGVDLQVVNVSVPAQTTPLHLRRLPRLLDELAPDLVLIDVGYTDAVARIRYADFVPDHSHMYRAWSQAPWPLWRHSVLLDGLARRLGHGLERAPSIHAVAQQRERGDMAANFAATTIQPFEANVRALVAEVAASNAQAVLLTQPTSFVAFPGEGDPATWVTAMGEANAALQSVAVRDAVPLVDVAAALSERDELFVDGRRTNAAGQRERAAVIAAALRAGGLLARSKQAFEGEDQEER
ncbi:MAG: SGNH/GDSL hydrolase family protein [Planctomycetota bacterium]